jgi:microcompartment protein CcmK/EutM
VRDWHRQEKGDSPHLCETPEGPFRQMGTVPFFLHRNKDMRIGDVIGTVTLNRAHPSLAGASLKLVAPLSWDDLAGSSGILPLPERKRQDAASTLPLEEIVVFDPLGAGAGSRIAVSEGREAAMPFHPDIKPIDAYNAAILDTLDYDPSDIKW